MLFRSGPYLATFYVVIGATIGALAVFIAARYAFQDFFRQKVGSAAKRMEAGFRANELTYMFILRLVPLFPFWLVNLVPAFLGVSVRTYVIGTLIGIIPGAFVYSLVGDGADAVLEAGGDLYLAIIFEPRFLAPIVGLAFGLVALCFLIWKPDMGLAYVTLIMAIVGTATGLVYPVTTVSIQNAVPHHQMGVAMGAMNFFREIGRAHV